MTKTVLLLVCAALCASLGLGEVAPRVDEGDDALEVVHERLFDFFLANGDCTQNDPLFCATGGCGVACDAAKGFQANLKEDFSWPDIDYKDQTRSTWNTSTHMSRVVVLARALECPSCTDLYHSEKTRNMTVGALLFWFAHDFQNPNWWWNDFGVPQLTETAVFLLNPHTLPTPAVNKAITILERANGSYTGQNLVWSLEITIGRAVIANNTQMLAHTFAQLWSAIFFTLPPDADGIQIDGSFFQHGPLLQSGAYGGDFSLDTVVYVHIARNTSVAIDDRAMNVLSTFWLEGQQYMMRWNGERALPKTNWDVSVKGREISRAPYGMLGVNTDPLIPSLRETGGPRAQEFQVLAARLAGEGDALVGSRHYWLADYTVHHRAGFFLSVRSHSSRTYASECVNGENQLGWHLADGATFIMQRGDEYQSIFPVWSWTRIPGTTARQSVNEKPCEFSNKKGPTSFVGGVCSYDVCVSALDFQAADNGAPGESIKPLTAKKAWFMIHEGMIACGANITLMLPGPVTTTLDQTMLTGPVVVSTKGVTQELPRGTHNLSSPDYIFHNNVAYIPALRPGQQLFVRNDVSTGTWQSIATAGSPAVEKHDTLTMEIDHGTGPRGATYAYAVLPNITAASVDSEWASLSQRMSLINTPAIQALQYRRNISDTVIFIAAYRAASLQFTSGLEFEASVRQPSLWVLTKSEAQSGAHILTVAAASPLATNTTLTLTVPYSLTGGSGGVSCRTQAAEEMVAEAGAGVGRRHREGESVHAHSFKRARANVSTITVTLPAGPTTLGMTVSGVCTYVA
eukprot:m.32131 g.32131  ORF g.32131 m.32131 type:complete len:799 (+) comp9368_c0_seq2:208-2604(+)